MQISGMEGVKKDMEIPNISQEVETNPTESSQNSQIIKSFQSTLTENKSTDIHLSDSILFYEQSIHTLVEHLHRTKQFIEPNYILTPSNFKIIITSYLQLQYVWKSHNEIRSYLRSQTPASRLDSRHSRSREEVSLVMEAAAALADTVMWHRRLDSSPASDQKVRADYDSCSSFGGTRSLLNDDSVLSTFDGSFSIPGAGDRSIESKKDLESITAYKLAAQKSQQLETEERSIRRERR